MTAPDEPRPGRPVPERPVPESPLNGRSHPEQPPGERPLNGRPLPERGPLFEPNPRLREAMDRLLAEHAPGDPPTSPNEGDGARTGDDGRDRRAVRESGSTVLRVDVPGLATVAKALGTAAAERLIPIVETALVRSIRHADRVVRIGPTTELVIVAGRLGPGDGSEAACAERLQSALETIGLPVRARVRPVPGAGEHPPGAA